MKLKGKLITGFTTVVMMALIIFGLITYYTFVDAENAKTRSIVELQAETAILKTHSKMHHKVIQLLSKIRTKIPPLLNHKIPARQAAELFQATAVKEPLVDGIFIYQKNSNTLIPAIDNSNDPNLSKKLANINEANDGAWFWEDKKLYLVFAMDEIADETFFIMEIDQSALRNYLNSQFTIEQSVIYLTQDNKLFMPPIKGNSRQGNAPDIKAIISILAQNGKSGTSPLGKAYRPGTQLFGTNATFLIPNNFFNSDLISLKNRIITAMLVVGWCAIWIILILAHSIANPISKLNKLTKDIISFNYSTKLEVKPSRDEIGELAINFETMRLKIKDLVTKDQLTHVYNRRFLMHVFELAVLRALRLEEELCCIMIDIDFFKKVNDTYGHQAGDSVLVDLGKILLEQTRDYDTPARYGGEEFILVLPNTDITTANDIAERIRKKVQNSVVNFEEKQINYTLSLGISNLDKYDANTTEKIIGHADSALYQAKESGRNQTIIYKI